MQYFNEYLSKWDETLVKDIEEKEQIEKFIKQLESPFGFLDQMAIEVYESDDEEEEEDKAKPKTQMELMLKDNEKRYKAQEVAVI